MTARPLSPFVLAVAIVVAIAVGGCAAGPTASTGAFPVPAGGSFRDRDWAPEMVVVPPGRFTMGATEEETAREQRAAEAAASERPRHAVAFAAPLAVGRVDVTVDEFDRFVKATGRRSVFEGCVVDAAGTWRKEAGRSYADPLFAQSGSHPAVCTTWADARDYAAWLSRETGHVYRLLHEEEWEYAARAGTATARWWGDDRSALCVHANGADQRFNAAYPGDPLANTACDDGYAATSPGTAFPANAFGLHDMIGNAWQWLGDCFRPTYDAPVPDDASCQRRVIRGGSWHNHPDALRAAARFWLAPDNRSSSIGLRVAREPDRPARP